MARSSILTFNFNGYDTFHSHFYINSLDYVLVTDDISHNSEKWDIKYPDKLKGLSPWEQSLYVRYHPFEFVNSNVVIVIDGSMVICEGIIELNKLFVDSEYEVAMPLSHMPLCKERISNWYVRSRISHAEKHTLIKYLKDNNAFGYNGCLAGAVKLIKKTDETVKWLHHTWELLYSLNGGSPIRLDEVIATITLRKEFQHIKFAPLSTNVMNGEAFYYTYHKTGCRRPLPIAYPPHLDNVIVTPWHIGKEYRHTYEYKCEAMCLTRYFDEQGLAEWIEHHLSIGFDHIHIFDNDSPYECERICKEYGSKVSYERVSGYARHYQIYDDYVNSERCKSEWVIPLDDDEYLELNHDICQNVHDCIDWYIDKFRYDHMFAIRWKHLFPKQFHSECTGAVLDYCTEENRTLAMQFQAMGDLGVKTFVHRYGRIHYEERNENPSGGHVPKHSVVNGARLFNGEVITTCSCSHIPREPGEPARVIHCRYKGYSWYKAKYLDITSPTYCYGNCDAVPYIKKYKFNSILETLI